MDITKLKQDGDLAEEGVWVDFDDCKFKIRSADSATYRRTLGKLTKRKNSNRLQHDPEALNEITVESCADGLLVDWADVEENGEPLDIRNRKDRLKVCSVTPIRDFLIREAQDIENYRREATAADAENFPSGD